MDPRNLKPDNENIDEIMTKFAGKFYQDLTKPKQKTPENSILNAPCLTDKYGNVVVNTTNISCDLAIQPGPEEIERETKPGHKWMSMWDKNLKDYAITQVPENTPESINEEIAKGMQCS